MLAPDRVTVDEAFFEERIRTALAVRQKHLPGASSFRVVNAESDFLSGLIVDKAYEDVARHANVRIGDGPAQGNDCARPAKNLFTALHCRAK